ncbi:MAG: DNA alkylation repair protein [Chlamydiales bacterium]
MIPHLKKELSKKSIQSDRIWMEGYMRHLFPFYGVKSQPRKEIVKTSLKQFPIQSKGELITILEKLWNEKKREFHHVAMDLGERYHKLFEADSLSFFEVMIRKNSWWDSIDRIAPTLVGLLLQKYPELLPEMDRWIEDENMWIRRSALIYQLKYKEKTDKERLFSFCKSRMHEEEFFIRKAIGWVLRQYARTNPESVREFIEKNRSELSSLSFREASKYL